jgi:hypothetical protein
MDNYFQIKQWSREILEQPNTRVVKYPDEHNKQMKALMDLADSYPVQMGIYKNTLMPLAEL